ncbi:MAG TPA: DUF3604 domain-containing protein [Methylomirabilota bacterium]|nr:DUF3604 domain-containing protein [Methylomirabilota bacterium]
MSQHSKVATVAVMFSAVVGVMCSLPILAAAETDADRTRPGYIPDPQGYWQGNPFDPGKVGQTRTPQAVVDARAAQQRSAQQRLGVDTPKQILFGDMHVHSTYSVDAFRFSLPLMQGSRGAYPPADACDYARYISQLDFYWITDHAESYTPQHWKDSVEAIRQCNAVAGDPHNPDLVAFVGWEWTQMGATAKDHYGHHNVFFRDTDPEKIPSRPIGATGSATDALRGQFGRLPAKLKEADPLNRSYYEAFDHFVEEMGATPNCAKGVNTRELPKDCFETAADPAELFKKLDEWGFDTMVIPHGSTWGIYTPPDSSWNLQLVKQQHDPEKMNLIEVYSGHGNSENYRDFRARKLDENGKFVCPEPQANYLPACWQAGEIIRKRCKIIGLDDAECDQRAVEARQNFVKVDSIAGWLTVPGTEVKDWLDAGQARDIFLPAFNYQPLKSVQYGLAIRNFDDPKEALRYKWGFISSSDNHSARPGTGFKQYDRKWATEAFGERNEYWHTLLYGKKAYPAARSVSVENLPLGLGTTEFERISSFWNLGGLVAVHAAGRNREAIWDALKRKEVYGTSGPRILLWFDLLNGKDKDGKDAVIPMGGETAMKQAPKFRVHAAGSFKQRPGCPDWVKQALSAKHLQKLASGECYNPSDERYYIDRIEVVRIRPQNRPDEPVQELIEDQWKVFTCERNQAGCRVEFSDPDFTRDTVYYVRAIQEDTPTVNGKNLRTTFDEKGNALDVTPCYSDYRTEETDNCLGMVGHRAWSSPIYVDYAGD